MGDTAIGAVAPGRTAAAIHAECLVLSDSTELWQEGLEARILRVVVGGHTITAVIDSDRVDNILVEDSSLRTPDSLGVGSTLGDLLKLPDLTGTFYEGAIHVSSPKHCGLGFLVQPDSLKVEDFKQDWSAADLRRVASSSPVLSMTVGRCVRARALAR